VKVTIHDAAVPLALYIPRISSSYEVFAEGKFIGGCGGLPPNSLWCKSRYVGGEKCAV